MQEVKKIHSTTKSLLRYPGSKARLARFIAETIEGNGITRPTLVEPFCGGASVSIALLESGFVGEIVLNDIDPLVGSLWKCVFSKEHAEWLADAIMHVSLTIDYWKYQKQLEPSNLRDTALKCLFLNRTSFSGVLHKYAGPIGGYAQKKWTLGCRFNREKLSARILELSSYANRVRIMENLPWVDVCEVVRNHSNTFLYLDPPFYHKAERLYRYTFNHANHLELYRYLTTLEQPWLLSYDNAQAIKELYDSPSFNACVIDNTYSAHPMGGNSFIGRELVYSNLEYLPLPADEKQDHCGLTVKNLSHADYFVHTKRPTFNTLCMK